MITTSIKSLLYISFALFFTLRINAQEPVSVQLNGIDNSALKSKIESNTLEFLNALNTSFIKKSKPKIKSGIITDGALVSLLSMWEMSNFFCKESTLKEMLLKKPQGGYEVRNIKIYMDEAAADDKEQEMVLVFNNVGVIDNIYMSIETNRYNQLVSQGKDVVELRRRQIILDFIENFRTAYNRKDLSYIESVYSEDALIITGKVVKVSKPDASGQFLPQQTVQYQKQNKKEYIDKLSKIFSSNSYINVKFDDIEIKQHKKFPSVYGVNMMQGWNTSKYSDEGYLLLVVDFSDDDKPLIHVRTWQPDKVGGKSLAENEKFKLEMFNIKQ